MTMRELVEILVRSVVENPEQVRVESKEGEASSLVEVRVPEEDFGRVIGRNGGTIKAIRAILNSVAAKEGRRVIVDVIE